MNSGTMTSGRAAGRVDEVEHGGHDVQVHVDYISADEPIHRKFPQATQLVVVKTWAREQFVPHPPSDKTYYLNDEKTRHRFTAAEEEQTLAQLGYTHSAHLRLNEEQVSGERETA